MNTPGIENRFMGQGPETCGTLTDKWGRTVPVKFSLTQWQPFMDEIPDVPCADGELEFLNVADAFDLRDVAEGVTLEGGGIQAEVALLSMRAFRVVGGDVNDDPMLHDSTTWRPAEMIHG